jgi:hypothetical protein
MHLLNNPSPALSQAGHSQKGQNNMTTVTRETTVTAEMTTEQIVGFMLANGSPMIQGETYVSDWVEEGDPVGMTLGQLMAEWVE